MPFSIRETITGGWHLVHAHSALVFKILLLFIALELLRGGIDVTQDTPSSIVSIGLSLVEIILAAGVSLISLHLVRDEPTNFRDLFQSWRIVWQYVAGSFVVAVLVLILAGAPGLLFFTLGTFLAAAHPFLGSVLIFFGLIVAVLVGIYLGVRYSMVRFVSVDGERDISDIIKVSSNLTRGVEGRLLLFFITIILLNIAGVLLLLVGLLVTLPVSMLAYAKVYEHLLHGERRAKERRSSFRIETRRKS